MQNEKGTIQKAGTGSPHGANGTTRPRITGQQTATPHPGPLPDRGGEGARTARRDVPAWWLAVPQSEKAVIRDVVASIRGLKRSKSPQISQAARKWERGIVCFIRFRLMGERRGKSPQLRVNR